MSEPQPRLSESQLAEIRSRRRNPQPFQFDYLHLRDLLHGLRGATAGVEPGSDVLDVYCGSKPYSHLVPADCRYVGIDVTDEYGIADVVTDEFLPFKDDSFDVVLFTEAFHYVEDPERGVSELRRVLRPGGRLVLSIPLVWEYNRTILERRHTGPELAALFADWDDVEVSENGGRAVAWATLTGSLLRACQRLMVRRGMPQVVLNRVFAAVFVVMNLIARFFTRVERAYDFGDRTLPMNVMITARAPRA